MTYLRDLAVALACLALAGTVGFINNTPEFYGEIFAKAVKAYNAEMDRP